MIYLDYSATTPVRKEVLDTFNQVCLEYIGNSNSIHSLGIKAHELEVYSLEEMSKLLKLESREIVITSSASEANNLAIKGICTKYQNRGKKILIGPYEHSSVKETVKFLSKYGFQVIVLKTRDNGLIDMDYLKKELSDDVILVSVCYVDSELGIRQPVDEISKEVRKHTKCFFHVDCTQALGKIDVDFNLFDLATISGHKIYGLKGVGALIKRKNVMLEPLIHGGKSTTIYRSGTPALALMVSLLTSLRLIIPKVNENYEYVSKLNKFILEKIGKYERVVVNSSDLSVPQIINISILGIKPEAFIHALDINDVYISTKSACSDASSVSESVYEKTHDKEKASSSLRISLSYMTREDEVIKFLDIFDKCYMEFINL